jgi:hypothetical protein
MYGGSRDSNRQARVRLNRAYSQNWVMWDGVPQGSVLAPLLFLFVINDLQDRLPKGVYSSLFADDSALWVHTPRREDAVPVLQEGAGVHNLATFRVPRIQP